MTVSVMTVSVIIVVISNRLIRDVIEAGRASCGGGGGAGVISLCEHTGHVLAASGWGPASAEEGRHEVRKAGG
jgi:hypothetical protein